MTRPVVIGEVVDEVLAMLLQTAGVGQLAILGELTGVELPRLWEIEIEPIVHEYPGVGSVVMGVDSRLTATTKDPRYPPHERARYTRDQRVASGWWGPVEAVDKYGRLWRVARIVVDDLRLYDRTGECTYRARGIDLPERVEEADEPFVVMSSE